MGHARMMVTLELLRDLLCLPDSCEIVLVDMASGYLSNAAMLTVKSPDFPISDYIPEILSPIFKRENNVTKFVDWRYPKKE